MSSLWTPGGERPVGRPSEPERPAEPHDLGEELSHDDAQRMTELRDRLAATPAEVVVANHAYGLFELAALHLSLERPQLDQARTAIDALGYLVEGMGARLGEAAEELTAALAQLRLAYVQVQAGFQAGPDPT